MCGRFVNLNKVNKINKIFEIDKLENFNGIISYNIAPSQSSIMITNYEFLKIEKAKWGFKFFDKKNNLEKNIINARLETINDRILFKESFQKRKCIIPANGYYEWVTKNNIKMPYFIHIFEKQTFYFAGIWKYLNFHKNTLKVFVIITQSANSFLNKIHQRMPVTLTLDEAKNYLEDRSSNYLTNNFNSKIEKYLDFFKVSKFVNNPFNNSEQCIKPIN